MAKIVMSAGEALDRIYRFEQEVEKNHTLQDRLPFARAWYALRDEEGNWHFGPSKFIGYANLSGDAYVKEAKELDGRRTERQLRQWFVTLSKGEPLHKELSGHLSDFLEEYGKAPSNLARINVAREFHEVTPDSDPTIVDLMIAVARRLPKAELTRLRAAL